VLTDPSNHRGRPWVHHPVSRGAVLAEAPQAADWRRRHGRGDLITVVISAIAVLHVPQDVEEGVDVARQRKRAPRRVSVLALGVVEEAAEERVGGVLRAHHEAHPLGTHVHREAPGDRRRRRPRPSGSADPVQPRLAPLQGS